MHVFVSVQWERDKRQQRVLDVVLSALQGHGFAPLLLEENDPGRVRDPLPQLRRALARCSGAVIVAFDRLRIVSAVEYPESGRPLSISNWRLPSIWNQIEAAMAYQTGRPVLVLYEEGLQPYGIIDKELTTIRAVDFSLRCEYEAEEYGAERSVLAAVDDWCKSLKLLRSRKSNPRQRIAPQ